MLWRILVRAPAGADKEPVPVDGGVARLTDFSVDAAGSCLEASFTALPSAVNIAPRDIITLQTHEGGVWTDRWKGFVTVAGNPRSNELQEYRAVGLKQRFYENVLQIARVAGADAGEMARAVLTNVPLPVGATYSISGIPLTLFTLGDRYPALESVGSFLDALAAPVGRFIVPTGETYVYDGVTYAAEETVPAVMWGVDASGVVFFRRPQRAAVAVSESDASTRVTWTGMNAEEMVDSPVLVYATAMVGDGWERYSVQPLGVGGGGPVYDKPDVPLRPIFTAPLAWARSSAQAVVVLPWPLDHMKRVAWTTVTSQAIDVPANTYDDDPATWGTGTSGYTTATYPYAQYTSAGTFGDGLVQGILRLRYQTASPPPVAGSDPLYWDLVIYAETAGGAARATMRYVLPDSPDVMAELYFPFLLPAELEDAVAAEATQVRVFITMKRDVNTTTNPRLYDVGFYAIDDAAALKLATAYARTISDEVATAEVQSIGAITQALDLTTVAGPVLSGLRVERTSYRITVEDGVATTYHVGQAFEPDLEAQRIVLERLARKALNVEPVSLPVRVKP